MSISIVFPDGSDGNIDDLMDFVAALILTAPDTTLKVTVLEDNPPSVSRETPTYPGRPDITSPTLDEAPVSRETKPDVLGPELGLWNPFGLA